jgi:hypothetical protein
VTEPWHDECLRLRAEGLSQPEIAIRLKLPRRAVLLALDETPEQKILMRRVRDRLRQPRTKVVPRPVKAELVGEITADIKRAAILAFSKHEISRGELMRRITPRDKWAFRVE